MNNFAAVFEFCLKTGSFICHVGLVCCLWFERMPFQCSRKCFMAAKQTGVWNELLDVNALLYAWTSTILNLLFLYFRLCDLRSVIFAHNLKSWSVDERVILLHTVVCYTNTVELQWLEQH